MPLKRLRRFTGIPQKRATPSPFDNEKDSIRSAPAETGRAEKTIDTRNRSDRMH